MTDLSPETVERMVALVRRMAGYAGVYPKGEAAHEFVSEASAIAADLPEPVDPDLVEAREIMEARYYINDPEWQGDLDTTRAFKLLKRGRALERGEAR